ncbi:MAG: hypothetical protein LBI78_07630 [Campylobacteraceae bacterium]|jgi:hypothetical protein|nr:hypothetical protein [Campylobacteraceae bacterium]
MISNNNFSIERVIFTNDFLRIYENQSNIFTNPFKNNVHWLEKICGIPILKSLQIKQYSLFFGDENGAKSLRWKIYNSLELPFSTEAWAFVYEDIELNTSLMNEIQTTFENALIISFEIAPSIIKIFTKLHIPFIDFAIHPVRFLEDYVFAIRTNVKEWEKRIAKHHLDDFLCREKARMYMAKSSRLQVFNNVPQGSVFFVGQTNQDSSLIANKIMTSLDEVKMHLESISKAYPCVHYKAHPHNKDTKEILSFLASLKKVEVVNYNIYDVLGSGAYCKIFSISSGTLLEANYFDLETHRLSPAFNSYDINTYQSSKSYFGLLTVPILKQFWDYLFYDKKFSNPYVLNPYKEAFSKTLTSTWGGRI